MKKTVVHRKQDFCLFLVTLRFPPENVATSTIFVHSTNIPYSFDGVIFDKGMMGGDDRNNTKSFKFSNHDEIQTIDMRVTMTVFWEVLQQSRNYIASFLNKTKTLQTHSYHRHKKHSTCFLAYHSSPIRGGIN